MPTVTRLQAAAEKAAAEKSAADAKVRIFHACSYTRTLTRLLSNTHTLTLLLMHAYSLTRLLLRLLLHVCYTRLL
jgi:hypothetical protein